MAARSPHRIVVAGGSLAGHSAVSELLSLGHGGEIVWITGEEHRPYSKPALSKEFMQARSEIADILLPEIAVGAPNLRIMPGERCAALDAPARSLRLEGGETIAFDGLLICTGAAARMPAFARDVAGVMPLRTLGDAVAIRSALRAWPKVLILGGGLIGCELAASMRGLGLEVTIVEQTDTLLGRPFGGAFGDYFLDLHRRNGVRVATGLTVERFATRHGRVAEALLSDGTAVAADLVIVGAGAEPATAWLQGSGLALSDGVECDAFLAASHQGIYAAGDVARWFNPLYGTPMRVEHWTNASAQGHAAARNLLFRATGRAALAIPFCDVPYFWSDQYGLKIQMVGWHAGHDRIEVAATGDGRGPLITYYGNGRLVAAAGVNAPRAVMRYRKEIEESAKALDLGRAAAF